MNENANEFGRLVGAVLRRFFVQNAQPPPLDAELTAFGANLWSLVATRGLPRPLAAGERGEPGGMSEAECAPLVAHVLGGSADALRVEAARQLVKACFYPEFTTCRDSFRQVSPDGACRRQQLARGRGRVSGTHCVDCPHWIALAPAAHAEYVAAEWRAGAADFAAHRDVFLPEDFRALRRWLHARARQAPAITLQNPGSSA
ncbi:MAG: hypothetical protein HY736_20820 [Verrucomicrobia bacterium]|nr:hypothetical protein [Verrucomicrobiota bacterium]